MRIRVAIPAVFFILYSAATEAQRTTTNQLWLDYVLDIPVAPKWLFENETSYKTLLSSDGKWRSLSLTPDIERDFGPHFDMFFSLPLEYTQQTESYETFETRFVLGSRFYFTPGKRIETRLTMRFEERLFTNLDDHTTEFSHRGRFRGEVIVPINQRTFNSDQMWYAIADAEAFVTIDNTVAERFSNQARFRLGLGYRFTYNLRIEALYTYQLSRDHAGDSFDSQDNIIRVRVKQYLATRHPAKERDNSN